MGIRRVDELNTGQIAVYPVFKKRFLVNSPWGRIVQRLFGVTTDGEYEVAIGNEKYRVVKKKNTVQIELLEKLVK